MVCHQLRKQPNVYKDALVEACFATRAVISRHPLVYAASTRGGRLI